MNDTTHPEVGATDGDRDVATSRDERAIITRALEHVTQQLREVVRNGSALPGSDARDLARHETLLSRFRAIDGVS